MQRGQLPDPRVCWDFILLLTGWVTLKEFPHLHHGNYSTSSMKASWGTSDIIREALLQFPDEQYNLCFCGFTEIQGLGYCYSTCNSFNLCNGSVRQSHPQLTNERNMAQEVQQITRLTQLLKWKWVELTGDPHLQRPDPLRFALLLCVCECVHTHSRAESQGERVAQ